MSVIHQMRGFIPQRSPLRVGNDFADYLDRRTTTKVRAKIIDALGASRVGRVVIRAPNAALRPSAIASERRGCRSPRDGSSHCGTCSLMTSESANPRLSGRRISLRHPMANANASTFVSFPMLIPSTPTRSSQSVKWDPEIALAVVLRIRKPSASNVHLKRVQDQSGHRQLLVA